jgi:hypothetical protein
MMIKIAACLLAVGFLAACESTNTTKRETLRETTTRYANNESAANLNGPVPPAEGPENVPPGSSMNPLDNPALVPTPLLRDNAAGDP